MQGASLEIVVPDASDLDGFVSSWVMAASEAQGISAKTMADLEPLESQDALRQMIQAAADGISGGRKSLTQLGPNPSKPDVDLILQQVTWILLVVNQVWDLIRLTTAVVSCHLGSLCPCVHSVFLARPRLRNMLKPTRSISRLRRG